MGLGSNGGKVTYRLVDLRLDDARSYPKKKSAQAGVNQEVIDVDMNNVYHIIAAKSGDPVGKLCEYLVGLAQDGAQVQPICDPPNRRPVAKVATQEHKATRKRAEIKTLAKRAELRVVQSKLQNRELSGEERSKL